VPNRAFLLAILALGLWNPPPGQGQSICLEDGAGLGPAALSSFEREFRELLPGWTVKGCGGDSVRVSIRFDPPARYRSALGLAQTNKERVLPCIELYVNPLLRLLGGVRAPAIVGRALARVAAHEVAHYALQLREHHSNGLLRPGFRSAQLLEQSSASFTLPPP